MKITVRHLLYLGKHSNASVDKIPKPPAAKIIRRIELKLSFPLINKNNNITTKKTYRLCTKFFLQNLKNINPSVYETSIVFFSSTE